MNMEDTELRKMMENPELREEMKRLKESLAISEQQRLAGARTYSLDEVEEMLRDIINGNLKE